jgi:hypothetical protein
MPDWKFLQVVKPNSIDIITHCGNITSRDII